jgi:predicted nucleic acid-binding protein
MSSVRDLVPAAAASPPIALPTVRLALAEMYVVAIDTSVITGDVIKSARGGLPSPLYLAMGRGLVRGYMAHHTWAEVPRVLAKRAPRENCDLAAVEKLWWDRYVKLIRFVPTADLPPGDPELEKALGSRDPSDLPTLKLASLIAPAVVLAADRDLVGIGLAYERWWDVPEAVRKMIAG